MRRARGLESKTDRLAKRTGINRPPEIPVKDCLHIIEGTTEEEIQEKKDRIKAKVAQKYGPRVLNKLFFVTMGVVESETEKKHGEQDN